MAERGSRSSRRAARCAARRSGPAGPMPSARYPTRQGLIFISRAHVASTAGRFVPITRKPECLGVPMIGPSPSMPMIPSTMARCGRTAAAMSRMRRADPRVVEHVLGPAVDDARHDAEEILERERDAGPVMCLQLGERDDQVGPRAEICGRPAARSELRPSRLGTKPTSS